MALFSNKKETAFQKLAKDFGIWREKNAEETILGDNTDNWQNEIANSAFTNNPYFSNYACNVSIDKMDSDHGGAFGNISIKNKVEDDQLNPGKEVKVPIIIQDRHLKPFDIMNSDGKIMPLSEERLRDILFTNNIVEMSNRKPISDRYIGGQFAPPSMGYGGSNGFTYSADGMGKFASILSSINVNKEQKKDLYNKLANTDIKHAFVSNPSFAKCIDKIASKEDYKEFGEAISIRFKKLGQRMVNMKWISPGFEINEIELPLSKAAELMGNDDLYNTPPGESIIMTTNTAQKDTLEDSKICEIKSFGQYKVQDVEGNELMGYVIPIISLDNKPLPSLLFTNGSAWSLQDKIAGELVSIGTKLPNNTPAGMGVFYIENDGRVVCTEPIEISHSEEGTFICKDMLMQPLTIELSSVESPVKMGEGSYILPSQTKFMKLPEEMITLRGDPLTIEKIAYLNFIGSNAIVTKFGDDYRIDSPLLKTAQNMFNKEDAIFILRTFGFDNNLDGLVKHASQLTLYGGKEIPNKRTNYIKEAEDLGIELKKLDNIKIASELKDEESIDHVLSMDYLNSDNVQKYIDMLPEFEQTQNRLADLLFASRCGLSQVPEENSRLAVQNLDKLIKGLKNVKEKNLSSV